jgi:hypothetical protein
VAIGHELLIDPSVLMLDEVRRPTGFSSPSPRNKDVPTRGLTPCRHAPAPLLHLTPHSAPPRHTTQPTSGLDSTTALHVMQTMKQLAAGGRTIVASIHQPSSRIYQELDQVRAWRHRTMLVSS